MANEIVTNLLNTASAIAPNSEAAKIAEAAVATAAEPTNPVLLVKDVEMVIELVGKIKSDLNGKHPTLWTILHSLLF